MKYQKLREHSELWNCASELHGMLASAAGWDRVDSIGHGSNKTGLPISDNPR
jgi:hypothetical protein